jgi:nitrite reductase (NADH) small subunit
MSDRVRYRVGELSAIPERSCVLVRAGDVEVGVFKLRGALYAYENRCRHQGGPVCRGDVLARQEEVIGEGGVSLGLVESGDRLDIACPWHGWEYDVETGRNIADPTIRLRSFPVYEEAGEVFVEVGHGAA